jgi:hypothetical protein
MCKDRRYKRAADATAYIINNYLDPDKPKYWLWANILAVIIDAIYEFEQDYEPSRIEPSRN